MEYCKKCISFTEDFNAIKQHAEDINPKGLNYCHIYRNGIPKEIASDKEKCKYHIEVIDGKAYFHK